MKPLAKSFLLFAILVQCALSCDRIQRTYYLSDCRIILNLTRMHVIDQVQSVGIYNYDGNTFQTMIESDAYIVVPVMNPCTIDNIVLNQLVQNDTLLKEEQKTSVQRNERFVSLNAKEEKEHAALIQQTDNSSSIYIYSILSFVAGIGFCTMVARLIPYSGSGLQETEVETTIHQEETLEELPRDYQEIQLDNFLQFVDPTTQPQNQYHPPNQNINSEINNEIIRQLILEIRNLMNQNQQLLYQHQQLVLQHEFMSKYQETPQELPTLNSLDSIEGKHKTYCHGACKRKYSTKHCAYECEQCKTWFCENCLKKIRQSVGCSMECPFCQGCCRHKESLCQGAIARKRKFHPELDNNIE